MKTFTSFREETLYEATAHERVKAHPAVESVDDGGKGDYFVNLKKGWHWSGQRSFGNESATAALKMLKNVKQGDIEESAILELFNRKKKSEEELQKEKVNSDAANHFHKILKDSHDKPTIIHVSGEHSENPEAGKKIANQVKEAGRKHGYHVHIIHAGSDADSKEHRALLHLLQLHLSKHHGTDVISTPSTVVFHKGKIINHNGVPIVHGKRTTRRIQSRLTDDEHKDYINQLNTDHDTAEGLHHVVQHLVNNSKTHSEESAAWQRKAGKNPTGGLNDKGIASYRAEHPGSHLQKAVTGKAKPGSKDAKRRKSFCARMSGMPGPMKDEKGRPTRKALSLRKWKCH